MQFFSGVEFIMTEIEAFNELIKNEAKVEVKREYEKYYCELDEPQCSDEKLKLVNLPNNAVVIKADMFPPPEAIFSGTKSECKRADYIIIVESPKKRILYMELKRSTKSAGNKEITAQLRGAKCLLEYCKTIIAEFWGVKDILTEYQERFFKYRSKTLDKRPTRIDTISSPHNSPENAMPINGK